jgi:asparagine synthetase B (glutamine-hydrolysing)
VAALAARHTPAGQPIDLVNVAFARGTAEGSAAANFDTPDRRGALAGLAELRRLAPARRWRLILVDRSLGAAIAERDAVLALMHPAATVMDFTIGAALYFAAAAVGTLHDNGAPEAEPGAGPEPEPGPESKAVPEPAPAAAGRQVRSAARVVLSGLGADEQLAGYKGRHRNCFGRPADAGGGWAGLAAELAFDAGRLWLRNLGRDDRLISAHGREARFPYLDEAV